MAGSYKTHADMAFLRRFLDGHDSAARQGTCTWHMAHSLIRANALETRPHMLSPISPLSKKMDNVSWTRRTGFHRQFIESRPASQDGWRVSRAN